jgi:hypothetical protein
LLLLMLKLSGGGRYWNRDCSLHFHN